MKIFITLLFLFTSSLYAAEEQAQTPLSLASLEGEPSSIVHGCVSAITGDFMESQADLYLPGAEPIVIQRSYSSSSYSDRSMGHGWGLNHHGYLDVIYIEPQMIEHESSPLFPIPWTEITHDYTYSLMTDENGASMQFHCFSFPDEKRHLYPDPSALDLGVTNCSKGVISARTNWKNTKINYHSKKYHAVTGSGAHYEFDKHKKDSSQKDIHRLLSITKPNCNKFKYDYNSNHLTDIKCVNMGGAILNSIKIERPKSKHYLDVIQVKAPDGREITYTFMDKKLSGEKKLVVQSSCGSEQTYVYSDKDKSSTSKIIKKILPDARGIQIDYYRKGINKTGKENIEIDSSKDLRLNRVKSLVEPVGPNNELVTTCRFEYETGDDGKGSKKPLAGKTKVYDAYNHKTLYHYNKDHRLISIVKYKGTEDYKPYSRERLLWGENEDRKLRTLLKCRTFETGGGKILFARQFNYDDSGNILKDILTGNLTGNHPKSVILNDEGFPVKNGGNESFEKFYEYSDDGLNLMVAETDYKSRREFSYHPGTDLLSKQLLITGNKTNRMIRKRGFYDYDVNGALISEIIDDGCTEDQTHLKGVTERRIKTIANTKNAPIGLPEVIEEKYLDLTTRKEKLLHKTINKYDNKGYLKAQEHYGSDGKLAYTLQWDYNSRGQTILEVNALGEQIVRDYDDNGNKIYEQGPCLDYETRFVYDHANRLVSETKYSRDGTFTKSYTYDLLNRLKNSKDIYGNTTKYDYDEFGRMTVTEYPAYQDENGQFVSLKAVKDYNAMGNIVMQQDACGAITQTEYTIRGKPYYCQNPDGSIERNEYDLIGHKIKSVAKNGMVTYIDYDYQGRPEKTIAFSVDDTVLYKTSSEYNAWHLLSDTDPEGNKTEYRYDGAGRLIESKKAGRVTSYVYDVLGHTSEVREHFDGGYTAKIKNYDLLNRVIEERTEDNKGTLFDKTEYRYDADGNKILTIVSNVTKNTITTTLYNSNHEPVEVTDALGQKTIYSYSMIYLKKLKQYVPCVAVTDPSGNITTTIKDAMGHVVSVEVKNPMGDSIRYHENKYDSKGCKVKSVETVYTPGKSPRKVTTNWSYNTSGNVTDIIEAVGTPEQKHTQFIYNLHGQKETILKPDGVAIQHIYDAKGRLLEYFSSDKSVHYRYSYDRNDNLKQVEDLIAGSVMKKEYNAHGQVMEEQLANGLVMGYAYDAAGRIESVRLPDSSKISYAYNPLRLKEVSRLDASGKVQYSHRYETHDLLGNVMEATLIGNVGRLTHSRDVLGRTILIKAPGWTEKIDEYDPAGNLISGTLHDALGEIPCEYTYTDLHQLKTEKGVKNHTYVCDSLYNRLAKDGAQHVVNDLNQLKSDAVHSYVYDLAGRIRKKISSGREVEYDYDAMDRLISVKDGMNQTRYSYDAENRRIEKIHLIRDSKGAWTEQSKERYLYQGKNEIGVCDKEGRIVQLRVLGSGKGAELGAAVGIELDGRVYAPVHDHYGSVRALIDKDTGQVAEMYRYTAFGEEEIFNGVEGQLEEAINPWRYASKRSDAETGFVYFGRRYYDSGVGRWTTPDPIGFDGGPNLYAYVMNNPLGLMDLYGLSSEFVETVPEELKPKGGFLGMVHKTGECIRFLGDHLIPIPFVRDIISGIGHSMMAAGTRENFGTMCRNVHSTNGQTHGPEMNDKVRFVLINGIMNSLHECHSAALQMSRFLGGANVHYTYNSSHGMIFDLCECLAQKMGIPTHSVQQAVANIQQAIDEVGGVGNGGHVVVSAHSQGGLILQRALECLSPEQRQMIDVVTYGSASLIEETGLNSARNFVNTHDAVPYISDPIGCMKGMLSKNSNVEFVKSESLPLIDHTFLSSYIDPMEQNSMRFKDMYGR